MFNNITKNLLRGILLLGLGISGTLIRNYGESAGQSPELSVLTYCFGLVIGISFLLSILQLDPRTPQTTALPVMNKAGNIVITVMLLIFVVVAMVVANVFGRYQPEIANFAVMTYLTGLVIGFAAIGILYYLPNYLPQEKKSGEECPSSTRSLP